MPDPAKVIYLPSKINPKQKTNHPISITLSNFRDYNFFKVTISPLVNAKNI
jgi:hypothetical protein